MSLYHCGVYVVRRIPINPAIKSQFLFHVAQTLPFGSPLLA